MKLIEGWKEKFPKLWSVRFALLAAVMSSIEVGISVFLTGKPPLFASLAALASFSAAVARIIAQPALHE
jgi:hypothetical protein